MYEIKQSTAETIVFFAHDSAGDAITGLTDGSFTKRISKGSASFGAMTVTITEMELGFYSIPLSTSHSDTNGILTVIFTNAGAKQINLQWRVEARLVDDLNNAITAPTAVQNRTEMDDNSAQLAAIVADTNELQADDVPGLIATAQADLDIITGASGVNLLTATQASIDAIETDTGTTIPGTITTVQNDLDIITGVSGVNLLTATQASIDAIEADTNELQTDWANSGRLDLILDSRMAEASIDTTGGVVDSVTQVGTVVGGATSTAQTTAQNDLDIITGASGVNLLTATQATIDDIPTTSEFNARTPTAAQLAYITAHAETALPVTFSGGTTTTAIFTNVDGSGASSTDDVYNGRILIFNIGTLNQQVTDITDYVGSTTTATITAVTTAVTGSHTAILV